MTYTCRDWKIQIYNNANEICYCHTVPLKCCYGPIGVVVSVKSESTQSDMKQDYLCVQWSAHCLGCPHTQAAAQTSLGSLQSQLMNSCLLLGDRCGNHSLTNTNVIKQYESHQISSFSRESATLPSRISFIFGLWILLVHILVPKS